MAFRAEEILKLLKNNPPKEGRLGESNKKPLGRLREDFRVLKNQYNNVDREEKERMWLTLRDSIFFYLQFVTGSDPSEISRGVDKFVALLSAGRFEEAEEEISGLKKQDKDFYNVLIEGIEKTREALGATTRTK